MKPSFFIVGERKCATSSLYRYLISHPQVLPCAVKEPQFFSKPLLYRQLFFRRYLALFPEVGAESSTIDWFRLGSDNAIKSNPLEIRRDQLRHCITGEASANTFAQVPPNRLKSALPNIRLILCLRHPVDRAYAHYQMLLRFAKEGRRIALRFTEFQHDFEIDFWRKQGGYFAQVSLYTTRLRAWVNVFGWDKLYIVRSEDLHEPESAQRVLGELCAYFDIDQHDFTDILGSRENVSVHPPLDPVVRAGLMQYYMQDIRDLEMMTGRNFEWNT